MEWLGGIKKRYILFAFCMDCIDRWTMRQGTAFKFSFSPGRKTTEKKRCSLSVRGKKFYGNIFCPFFELGQNPFT